LKKFFEKKFFEIFFQARKNNLPGGALGVFRDCKARPFGTHRFAIRAPRRHDSRLRSCKARRSAPQGGASRRSGTRRSVTHREAIRAPKATHREAIRAPKATLRDLEMFCTETSLEYIRVYLLTG